MSDLWGWTGSTRPASAVSTPIPSRSRSRKGRSNNERHHVPTHPSLSHAADAELAPWGSLDEASGPEILTAGLTLWSHGDQEVGIWECAPGPSRWLLETNEFIHVVSGRMTVTIDGRKPLELAPGDIAVFPLGWSVTWEIAETLRKIYAIF
jgi:hypothetical protein